MIESGAEGQGPRHHSGLAVSRGIMSTIEQAYQVALARHSQGELREAEAIYQQILAAEPRHAPTLHMLGVLAHQANRLDVAEGLLRQAVAFDASRAVYQNSLGELLRSLGQADKARACFEQARRLDPQLAAAHFNLAMADHADGRLDQALAEYRQTIELMPQLPEAHHELGNLLRMRGDLDAAIEKFNDALALRPDFAAAANDRGNALQDQGRLDAAIESFRMALRYQPDMAAAHYNLGNALRAAGKLTEAVESYHEAARCEPALAGVWNNLGATLTDLGQLDQALAALEKAARLAPGLLAAHFNLGKLHRRRGALGEARAEFERVLQLQPAHAEAHAELGAIHQALHDWERAGACLEEALRLDPDSVDANCNHGVWCTTMGRYDVARQRFERALELKPDSAEAHFNLGMLLLSAGEYAAGWREYAWYDRCQTKHSIPFRQPLWQGEPLTGRTLLVVCNYGLGDTLQFVRYLAWARQQDAGQILLAAPESLHPLLRENGYGELVAPSDPVEFDVHLPVMMLPALHFAQCGQIVSDGPYLRPRAELVDAWRQRLADVPGLKVGIAWQGSDEFPNNRLRSPGLTPYSMLAELPGVSLVSLQPGMTGQAAPQGAGQVPLVDLGPALDRDHGAFMDSAAIISHLDLVVSCDTSLAHLAGALGAPVWVALNYAPDWRWQRSGDKTAWYPTMRLFRQPNLGDWESVFRRIAAALAKQVLRR